MHIKDAKAFGLLDTLYDCINQSKAFATELNLDEMKSGGAGAIKLAPVPPLYQLLPVKRYQKLRQIIKKALNIDLDRWAHAHPMIISNLISEAVLSSEMPVFLDDQLWQYASSKEKKMFGIETLEEQITIMHGLPLQGHVEHLKQISKNYSRFRRNLLRLLDHYEKGDLRSLHKAALKGAGKQKEVMVFERNKIMADRIDQLIQEEETIFCAVGAGHLSGEKGVLRFLKHNGYTLRAYS
jgi:uncharacterized protein YbaP (TraB family)